MTRKQKRIRRGALLIVVLSILVLFALIALTFVVVAGSFNRSAKAAGRIGITDDEGRQLVERAFLDLVRGTANTNSALYWDDDDGDGAVDEDTVDGSDTDSDGLIDEDPVGRVQCASLLEDLYGVDILAGTLAGNGVQSGDFVQLNLTPTLGTFNTHFGFYAGRVVTMLDGPCALLSSRIVQSSASGGASYLYIEAFEHPSGGAVVPQSGNTFLVNGRPFGGLAGRDANEDHDAPDRLNPHLGFVPSDATNYETSLGTPTPLMTSPRRILASFPNRAALLVDSDANGTPDIPVRDIYGNPRVVDNDHDGMPDGVWLDFAMPIKTAPDGRRYKPYVSLLCVDLDGRLNVNAHGTLAQTAGNFLTEQTAARNYGSALPAGGAAAKTVLPRGMGVGPPEVLLSGIIAAGNMTTLVQNRYRSQDGSDMVPGGRFATVGVDPMFRLYSPGITDTYAIGGYASPIDLQGDSMVGVDFAGRPIYSFVGTNEMQDPPYEMNLVVPDGRDTPYTAADLERILRYSDADTPNLSQRLLQAAPTKFNDTSAIGITNDNLSAGLVARRQVTTHSSRIPVPAVPFSIVERMITRMGGTYNEAQIRSLLPFEVLAGGKMNLNRLWGNGTSDNGTPAVVDDQGELATAETVFANVYNTAPNGAWLNDNPDTNLTLAQGRQLYARNLFVLMMLLMDERGGGDHRIDYRVANTEGLTDDQLYQLTARRIAQWAVNVVDSRDPDAIMTPFEYDPNPFDGWSVDDNPATVDSADKNVRDLVWGLEYPDLLLTESQAMHNRRCRDTAYDDRADATGPDEDAHPSAPDPPSTQRIHPSYSTDMTKVGDADLDQVKIPQGSLFLEFYCARQHSADANSGQNAVLPLELYNGSGQLDLARKDAETSTYPVWRVAISVSHHATGAGAAQNPMSPLVRRGSKPDTTTFHPERMSLLNNSDTLAIERYLWFQNTAASGGTAGETANNTFYRQGGNADLPINPGEYLLVGPRQKTVISGKPPATPPGTGDPTVTQPGDQVLDFSAGLALHKDVANSDIYPYIQPTGIATPNYDDNRVKQPTTMVAAIDVNGYPSSLSGLNVSEPLPGGSTYPFPGTWFDDDGDSVLDSYGDGTNTNPYRDQPLDSMAGRPLQDDGITDTQTVNNYRTAFLQRLANPLLRWNPESGQTGHNAGIPVNPYITVDWMPIDLTVYNGEDRKPTTWDQGAHGNWDPDDDNPQTPKFSSRYKSPVPFVPANLPLQSGIIWTNNTDQPASLTEVSGDDENFRYNLRHTLGFLNAPNHFAAGVAIVSPQNAAGAVGEPNGLATLTFPNRPYIGHYDLMLVPASAPGRLLQEFTVPRLASATFLIPTGTNSFYDPVDDLKLPFGHGLNFFHTVNTVGGTGVKVPHYYRLFDFVEVPSLFVGTRRWYDPTNTLTAFRPPHHSFSRFRDPGVININTMTGPDVWRGVMGDPTNAGSPDYWVSWADIDTTTATGRRGSSDSIGRFAGSFRGPWRSTTVSSLGATIMRPNRTNNPVAGSERTPLLQRQTGPSTSALDFSPRAMRDHRRHAQSLLSGLIRTANLFDKQSNVYAVWVTVGYFEVNENGVSIGRELGQDTGETTRHRGFYIVDRSIPVGYQRGVNHNVDKAVLLRRFIE